MSRILTTSALALTLVSGLTAAASAQSYTAPAGIPAVTAPGGLEGAAVAPNLQAYDGRAHQVRPGAVSVEGVYTTGSIRAPQAVRGRTAR